MLMPCKNVLFHDMLENAFGSNLARTPESLSFEIRILSYCLVVLINK